MHEFANDFYGLEIRVVVLGYVRPEYNYDSMGRLSLALALPSSSAVGQTLTFLFSFHVHSFHSQTR